MKYLKYGTIFRFRGRHAGVRQLEDGSEFDSWKDSSRRLIKQLITTIELIEQIKCNNNYVRISDFNVLKYILIY